MPDFPRSMPAKFHVYALLLLAVRFPISGLAENWPQWRGPWRDGAWRETGIVSSFPNGGLPVRWKVPVGSGWASPVVADGRLFLFDAELRAPQAWERIQCFDFATGRKLWSHAEEIHYPEWAFAADQNAGPSATPLVAGSRIYALGSNGSVRCLDAQTGRLIWSQPLGEKYQIEPLMCRASPLLEENRLIVFIGGKPSATLVALNADSGQIAWTALDEPVSNSSPIMVTAGGKRQLIAWTGASVSSLDPADGTSFWRQPMTTSNNDAVASPVSDGRRLLIGGLMLELDATRPAAHIRWPENLGITKRVLSNTSTALLTPEAVYSADGHGGLVGLDPDTGKELWRQKEVTDGKAGCSIQLTPNGSRVFLYTHQGDLLLAELSLQGYREISRTHLLDPVMLFGGRKVNWTPPIFADRCIVVRNEHEMVCASLAAAE